MSKQLAYERMAARLAPLWARDDMLSRAAPEQWQRVRDLDDALVRDRDDDTVNIGAYRMHCLEIEAVYTTWTPKGQDHAA